MRRPASNRPAHIVLLGDDRTLLDVLELVLQDEGYVVHGALRHGDGNALVSEWQPDLLILDQLFSGREGGLALLEQVKQEPALCAVRAPAGGARSVADGPRRAGAPEALRSGAPLGNGRDPAARKG